MNATSPKKRIVVAAGILERPDGAILLGQRPEGKPWPGWWELPGGKLEPGESVLDALRRELHEELGIQVTRAHYWVRHEHEYPQSHVTLHFVRVSGWTGIPEGQESQALRWVHRVPARADHAPPPQLPDHLGQAVEDAIGLSLVPATQEAEQSRHELGCLLPASFAPIRWLDLPSRMVRWTADQHDLNPQVARGDAVILRLGHGDSASDATFNRLRVYAEQARAKGAVVLLDSSHPVTWLEPLAAVGYHLHPEHRERLGSLTPQQMPHAGPWIGVEVADHDDLRLAQSVHADYVTLLDAAELPAQQTDRPAYWRGVPTLEQPQAGSLLD